VARGQIGWWDPKGRIRGREAENGGGAGRDATRIGLEARSLVEGFPKPPALTGAENVVLDFAHCFLGLPRR